MYFAFLDITDAVNIFMSRGGPVLNVIAMLLLVKWSLVFERIWYLNTTHNANVKLTLAEWNARSDTKSWSAHQIRTMMISKISILRNSRKTDFQMSIKPATTKRRAKSCWVFWLRKDYLPGQKCHILSPFPKKFRAPFHRGLNEQHAQSHSIYFYRFH